MKKKQNKKNKQTRKKRRPRTFSDEQVHALKRMYEVQKYMTAHECEQLATIVGLTTTQVRVWFENRQYKSKKQQMEHARLSPKGTKDSKDGVLTNSSIFTDLKTPSPSFLNASIQLALSYPWALPTPTAQTPLYTLPGSDYFRYPPLVKPGLPTLPNSIQQDLCHPSLT